MAASNLSQIEDIAPAPAPLSMIASLRIPVLRRLWCAQVISVFGDFLSTFALISFLTFNLHASGGQVVGIQIAFLLPVVMLGAVAGVFVDRWPLKPTLVTGDLIRCGLVLLLFVTTDIWQIYAIIAAIGVVSSVFGPAQSAAVRTAVPLHGLTAANSLMQQVPFVMGILGPAIAGPLVVSFGSQICYALDSLSFAISALLIATTGHLGSPSPALHNSLGALAAKPVSTPAHSSAFGAILPEMRVGFAFVLRHASLPFFILALASALFVLGCFGPLLALYVRDNVHAGNAVFGYSSALMGVGLVLGMNAFTVLGRHLSHRTIAHVGIGGTAVGLAVLAGWAHVSSTMIAVSLIGFTIAGIILPVQTLIQQETPPALLGRVGALVLSIIFAAQLAGLVLSGLLFRLIGIRQIFAGCSLLLVSLVLVGLVATRPGSARINKSSR